MAVMDWNGVEEIIGNDCYDTMMVTGVDGQMMLMIIQKFLLRCFLHGKYFNLT